MTNPTLRFACVALALVLLTWAAWREIGRWPSGAEATLGVPYSIADDGQASPVQTLDFYTARRAREPTPLVIFIDADKAGAAVAPSVANSLARAGVHTAFVRYRPPTDKTDVAAASDVAEALRFLKRHADTHRFDDSRVFLLARGASGRIATSLALDPQRYGLEATDLAGLITISAELGAIDVARGTHGGAPRAGRTVDQRQRWPLVPLTRPGNGQPPVLILFAERDPSVATQEAHQFADSLISAGNDEVTYLISHGHDLDTMIQWQGDDNHLVRRLILSFIGADTLPQGLANQLAAERRWRQAPPISTEPLWQTPSLVRSFPVDRRLITSLHTLLHHREYELHALRLREYHAVDLLDYLAERPWGEVGSGDYLVVTNLIGQKLVLRRQKLLRLRPQLVIGIDDERNLFRLAVGYRTRRDVSWEKPADNSRPQLIRPLGAFLHLPDRPASDLFADTLTRFALHVDSFRWVKDDPFAALDDIDPQVMNAFVRRTACLECHSFRGVGARSHHLEAWTARPRPGFALPLEDYAEETLRRFLYEQEDVAKQIGVTPVPLDSKVARKLYKLVAQERVQHESSGN